MLSRSVAAIVVCAAALGFGPPAAGHSAPAPLRYVPPLHAGDALPDAALVDRYGRTLRLQDVRGDRVLLLTFAYTRCLDRRMCPLSAAKFARLSHLVRGLPVRLLELTLDPAYDTPAVLSRYAARFGGDDAYLTLATGAPATVSELAARFDIARTATETGIVHSEAVAVVDRSGRIATIIDGNDWTTGELLAETRTVLGSAPNPVVRLGLWLASGVASACGAGRSGLSTGAALLVFAAVLAAAATAARRLFGSLFA